MHTKLLPKLTSTMFYAKFSSNLLPKSELRLNKDYSPKCIFIIIEVCSSAQLKFKFLSKIVIEYPPYD